MDHPRTGVERGGPGARDSPSREPDRLAAAGERTGAGRASGGDPLRGLHGPRGSGRPAGCRVGRPIQRARVANDVHLRDRDRLRLPRRSASVAEVAPDCHRGGGVVRRADRGDSACRGALQRGVRSRLQPASRAARVRGRDPLHDHRARIPGRTGGSGAGRSNEDEAGIACRAPSAQVARLRGPAGSGRGRGQPDRELDHRQRGRGDNDRLGRGPDRDTGRDRGGGDALPPLRDRPADQPHAGLRHRDRGARGDVRRGLADVGRGDRLGFHARDGRGHARRRAALQAASLAGPDSRGPALRSGPIRGPAQDRALPRRSASRTARHRRQRAR